jgi:8-oxo-dGTP pyrophosphatase MutT (NUDIX family)
MRESVALALVQGDQVLMQKRDNKAYVSMPGRWCLPGGLTESRETPEEAIRREFFEETDYKLRNPLFFVKYFYMLDDENIVGYIYHEVYDKKQKIKCQEGQKMEFKSRREIPKLWVIPRHNEFTLETISLFQD